MRFETLKMWVWFRSAGLGGVCRSQLCFQVVLSKLWSVWKVWTKVCFVSSSTAMPIWNIPRQVHLHLKSRFILSPILHPNYRSYEPSAKMHCLHYNYPTRRWTEGVNFSYNRDGSRDRDRIKTLRQLFIISQKGNGRCKQEANRKQQCLSDSLWGLVIHCEDDLNAYRLPI